MWQEDGFMVARMELKVWVEGIQRIVCGVTETTTCQVSVSVCVCMWQCRET